MEPHGRMLTPRDDSSCPRCPRCQDLIERLIEQRDAAIADRDRWREDARELCRRIAAIDRDTARGW